uniref:Kit ligand n=1 Tax=Salmo trutta TaxID=8032 RepID=A0A674AZC7_SALTR
MCFLCQIRTTTCVLLFLFTSLGVCSGGFGNPVTDDVKRVKKLCWSGVCWVLLNIYPLEQSLRELARVFGAISSNKDNIMIFITMLQNLRFQFDHEELEATMQVFKCHYRAVKWPSGLYFDYIRDILNSATHQEGGFRCVPPSCPAPTTPGKKHAPTHSIHSAPTYSIHKSLPHRGESAVPAFDPSHSMCVPHCVGGKLTMWMACSGCMTVSGPEDLQGMQTLVPAQHYYYASKSTLQLIIKCVSTHQQTNMVQAHQDRREEGTSKPIPPQETKKI